MRWSRWSVLVLLCKAAACIPQDHFLTQVGEQSAQEILEFQFKERSGRDSVGTHRADVWANYVMWLRQYIDIRMKKGWIMCRSSPPAAAAGRGHFSRCMLATDCGPGLTCFMGFLLLCPGFKSDSGDLPVIVSSFPVWCLLKGVL